MKKLLGIIVLGFLILTHSAIAKDLDWTGKRVQKYADTMCLALGVKEDKIKNSPWHKCKRQYLDVSVEYEKQYTTRNSEMHSGDYLVIDLQKIKKKNTSKKKKIDTVNQAKKKCIDLGFQEGTEKLADCALKLMTMNNLESETQTNIVSSSTSTQDKQYTFTGDATFGTNKKSKKHNKKVAKYMKMPEEVLCIAYINNSGIFKKAKQAARTEAVRTRGIDCNPYMDAAFYDKEKRKDGIAKAFRDLTSDQGDIARENEERRARNKNKNVDCTSRVVGDRVKTSCY